MIRRKLKCGGKPRKKAMLGADGAVMAAATLAAATMNVAATVSSAKQQAKAVEAQSKVQENAIKTQNENNNNLEKERQAFVRQENTENRNLQQDMQITLQQLAGQQNMNERLEASKQAFKAGGKVRRKLKKHQPFYGVAQKPFEVTDGGEAIPIQIDNNGFGLYELFGNDHEHYHKTRGGKNKSGVGIKIANGAVVEGEGDQNTGRGELFYVTPNDAMFISKHSIAGFNPRNAVANGIHPVEAFNTQEYLKDINGINDDGTKEKSSKKQFGGQQALYESSITSNIGNNTAGIIGTAIAANNRNVLKCGGRKKAAAGMNLTLPIRASIPGTATIQGGSKPSSYGMSVLNETASAPTNVVSNDGFWNNYGGAAVMGGANLIASIGNLVGNLYAKNKLSRAYNDAGNRIANAYRNLKIIDESIIDKDNYKAAKSMAVIRDPRVNINPQLEKVSRMATSQKNDIARNTLSSAARLQREAATDDRAYQKQTELYADKTNREEDIARQNFATITTVANENANREMQANRDYTNARVSLAQYNNDIVNQRILGAAGAESDALMGVANTKASLAQNTASQIGNALISSAQGFSNAWDNKLAHERNMDAIWLGADTGSRVEYAISQALKGDKRYAQILLGSMDSNNPISNAQRKRLETVMRG